MELWFDDNEKYEVYVSHTRVTLPYNKKEYELVIVYGLSEERPLILLTNIKSKEDVIKVAEIARKGSLAHNDMPQNDPAYIARA